MATTYIRTYSTFVHTYIRTYVRTYQCVPVTVYIRTYVRTCFHPFIDYLILDKSEKIRQFLSTSLPNMEMVVEMSV